MAKSSMKTILNTIWWLKGRRIKNRLIYYHSVHPCDVLSHGPEQFKEQVDYLSKNGYRSVLVRDIPGLLAEPSIDNRPWVSINFDDGYRDNVTYALPILREAGFVATFFIVAGMITNRKPMNSDMGNMLYPDRPMMTAQQVKLIVAEGMEIGSHGLSHRMATDLIRQSPDTFLAELRESKRILEVATGGPVVSFSYPNGQRGAFSDETRRLVAEAGYQVAVTTMWHAVTEGIHMLELPRCEVSHTDTIEEFDAKLVGKRDYLSIFCRVLDGSKVWRFQEAVAHRRARATLPGPHS